jgi:hypothetical protein
MRIEYTEFALAALKREFPDEGRRRSAHASLTFYLKTKASEISVPCPAFLDLPIFIYPFGQWRVLWEADYDVCRVWIIYRGSP